jgi:ATP-binding cassette subfamily C protein
MRAMLASQYLSLILNDESLRRRATICVVLALLAAASEIAVTLALVPILASLGVDAGEELEGFVERLSPVGWLILFAAAAFLRSCVNWQSSVQGDRGLHELTVSLQSRLYRALSHAHWDAVRRISPPKLTNALQTQAYYAGEGFSSFVQVTTDTLLVIGYLISAAFVLPLAVPFVLVLVFVNWRLNAGRSGRILERSEDYYAAQEDLHQHYEDWVAISRVASFGMDASALASRFEADARQAAGHAVDIARSSAFTRITYDAGIVIAILVGVPIAWALKTPPALLAFGLLMLVRVLPRIAGIHSGYQDMVRSVAPVREITKLAQQLERDPAAIAPTTEALNWQVLELTDVGVEDTLRDADRRWILRDVTLELRHGEWIALTGPTGAGKTTLADVMLTLVRPDAGQLQIDGRDVDAELASRWRNQSAYVPQDVVLFDASIRDNLKLYVPDATDGELEAALRKSAAGFVLERLPEGLDTRAGPGGRWLSGGERQRIGIARALLGKPTFLVLDEPTAAIDAATQADLMRALSELDRTMSVLLITHRHELLELADRVIAIDDGALSG